MQEIIKVINANRELKTIINLLRILEVHGTRVRHTDFQLNRSH